MQRLPNCSIVETIEKIKADDELKQDELGNYKKMMKFYQALELARSSSNVKYLLHAYTIECNFYRTLNRKLSNLSVSNNLTEYLAAILLKTDDNKDWPLCFTSIILKAAAEPESPLKSFCGYTYRGINITQEDLSLYEVNSLVVQKAFSSSSKQRSVAEKFIKSAPVGKMGAVLTFLFDDHNAVTIDLKGFSEYEKEEEVLVLPLSLFLVTNINRTSSTGYIEIEMKAINSEETIGSAIPQIVRSMAPIQLSKSTVDSLAPFSITNIIRGMTRRMDFKNELDTDDDNNEDKQSDKNDNISEDQSSVEGTEHVESSNEDENSINNDDRQSN
jgi:hypothetical protein